VAFSLELVAACCIVFNAGMKEGSVAACGLEATELDQLVKTLRDAASWGVVRIQWPDRPALAAACETADAHVLHAGSSGPCDELVELLGGRRQGAPLIVVGPDPAMKTAPDLWLPSVPSAAMLATMIDQLLDRGPRTSPAGLSWRRKSDMIIGHSAVNRQLLHSLAQLAPAQTPVFITGESGVGKELAARSLHFCGPRAKHAFIALNCAAIPEGLFEAELFGYQRGAFTGAVNAHAGALEAAHQGTLFLDEIAEMPLTMQAKMLRVLETGEVQRIGSTERKPVKFRLVTATNRTLEDEVKAGRFREDLYYRVVVYPLTIPPLRERPEDIPAIVTHHLSAIAARENRPGFRLTSGAVERLVGYSWPGNVRELLNLLERAVLLAQDHVIQAEHVVLPEAPLGRRAASTLVPYRQAKVQFEQDYYAQLMRTAAGNVTLAAKLGQKTRKEIYDALKRLGLDAMAYRGQDAPD